MKKKIFKNKSGNKTEVVMSFNYKRDCTLHSILFDFGVSSLIDISLLYCTIYFTKQKNKQTNKKSHKLQSLGIYNNNNNNNNKNTKFKSWFSPHDCNAAGSYNWKMKMYISMTILCLISKLVVYWQLISL